MWQLLGSQLRYRGLDLAAFAGIGFVLSLALTLWLLEPKAVPGIWQIYVMLFGLVNCYLWMVDQKERRLLLWQALPLRGAQISAGRLLLPWLVQIGAGGLAFVGVAVVFLVRGEVGSQVGLAILGAQGFALAVVLLIYLHEEVSLILSARPWARWTFYGAFIALFVLGAMHGDWILETWTGTAWSHGLAAVITVVVSVLFQRRRSLTIGVNPITGCLEDWSEAPAGGR